MQDPIPPASPATPHVPPVAKLPGTPPPTEPLPASALTPEEQMALFEKELKENDWGHQPC